MIRTMLHRSLLLTLIAVMGYSASAQTDFLPDPEAPEFAQDMLLRDTKKESFEPLPKKMIKGKAKKQLDQAVDFDDAVLFEHHASTRESKRHAQHRSARTAKEEKKQSEREARIAAAEGAFLLREQRDIERGLRLEGKRTLDKELHKHWIIQRKAQVLEETNAGVYADLHNSPMRPTYATYVPQTTMLTVNGQFDYATDAYGSEGTNGDITRLAFGESSIRVQDVLLASKLVKLGLVTPEEPSLGGVGAVQVPRYLSILADERIHFLGQAESWGLSIDVSRYVWKRHLVVGVQIPVVYKKHRLRVFMDDDVISKQFSTAGGLEQNGLLEVRTDNVGGVQRSQAFMQRYGQNTDKFIRDVFTAKGFDSFGGSSTGLGDVTFFAHAVIDAHRVDNLMVGMRFVVPTAQKVFPCKLWAPELGNGGVVEGAFWTSILMHKHSYFNPHIFIQANISSSAHVQRRVPRLISGVNNQTGNDEFLSDLGVSIPFADRIKLSNNASFDEFDTCFPHLGDNVTNLKMSRGPEFTVRVGNMFEQFPLRRSTIDLYYDFRVKFRDDVMCLNAQEWKPKVFEQCTAQIEHKLGFEWAHQFDLGSRWRFGGEYSFAGQNVAKTLAAHMTMNYSF